MFSKKLLKLSLLTILSSVSLAQATPSSSNIDQRILCEVQDKNSRLFAIELGDNSSSGRASNVYRHSMLGNVDLVQFKCDLQSGVLGCNSMRGRTSVTIFLQKPLVSAESQFLYKASLQGFPAKISDNFLGGDVDAICEFQGAGLAGEVPHGRVSKF
jgi:hypothetical protein